MNGAPDASLASLAVVPAKKFVDSESEDSENEDKPLAISMGDGADKAYYRDIGE